MKNVWKLMCIMVGLALLAAACGTAAVQPPAAPQQPAAPEKVVETKIVEVTAVPDDTEKFEHKVIVAVPADTSPLVDGSSQDEQYKSAPVTYIGSMSWQAVYTDKQLTLLIKWPDRKLILGNSGDFKWDPTTAKWTVVDVKNSSMYLNPAFAIDAPELGEAGCSTFCHMNEKGEFHHSFKNPSESTDSWLLMGKHGFWLTRSDGNGGYKIIYDELGLKNSPEDVGLQIGAISAVQNSTLLFDSTDKNNPNSILAGNVTLVGYAEDNVIVGEGHSINLNQVRDRPRDYYCMNCHNKIGFTYDPLVSDLTYPSAGEIQYFGNYDIPYTAPAYMEKAPVDFVDAMVLHQDEINNGEAVRVADLTNDQISEYWTNYDALKAEIPVLVLKKPTGQNAQILVGSNWTDGIWTMEVQRNLVTDNPESDVQFNDFTKDYFFGMSGKHPTLGEMQQGAILRFQP